jgi:hypothetical protein
MDEVISGAVSEYNIYGSNFQNQSEYGTVASTEILNNKTKRLLEKSRSLFIDLGCHLNNRG